MTIIAKDYTQFIKALINAGVTDLALVNWIKQPMRVDGMWRAKIAL